jgi:hypothetical protein
MDIAAVRMGPAGHQTAEARHLESYDDLVEPPTPSGEHETDASAWDFSSRQQAGRNSGFRNSQVHSQPTRHASLDAGYLQQRVYAASQVLDKSFGADRGQATDALSAFKGGKARSPGSATQNEGIEIAWVSVWCRCSQSCTRAAAVAVPLLLINCYHTRNSLRSCSCCLNRVNTVKRGFDVYKQQLCWSTCVFAGLATLPCK